MNAKRQAWLIACLIFLSAFFLYVKTLCSSLYVDDSGETATLAWTLSIGHPPGYPLHTLMARIFSLLPLGDPALRINLFAAFLGALCAPLAFACSRKFSGILPAFFTPIFFCLGPVFWHNALVAKGSVYMLNNLLTLLALASLLQLQGKARLRIFFLIFGLGLAHHYMSQVVMLPCYALMLAGRNWKKDLKQALWALPGISLYAFLFIRSAQNPIINWGEIKGLGDFIFFLSRAQYAAGEVSRTFAVSAAELGAALKYLVSEGRLAALLFAALAWRALPRHALFAGLAVPVAAVTLYLNLQGERLSIMEPYLFPAYLCQALLAAAGIQWLWGRLAGRAKAFALGAALLACLVPLKLSYASQDKSQYFFARDSARNVLQSLPKNAVLFSSGDAIIFPLWYLQDVKHERLDVALVGTPVLPMAWVRNDLLRRYPHLIQPNIQTPIGAESIDRVVYALLEFNKGRLPLYFSYNQLNAGIPNWKLVPQGPVYRALPTALAEDPESKSIAERNLKACVTRGYLDPNLDARTLKLIVGDLAIHHNALGVWLEDRKDYAEAMQQFMQASAINSKSEEFPFNVGNTHNELNQKEEALIWYQRSTDINPRYESAWFNLAATNFMLNKNAEGCMALQKTLEINPSNQGALSQKGRCPNLQ